MDNTIFEISDYYELLNLHKALLEARFHEGIDNRYLAGSPIIAQIHKRIISSLISMELSRKGSESWSEWIKISNRKDYLERAIDNIINLESWDNDSEKNEIVKTYISPFVATDEEIEEIIEQIDLKN
ncbi:MAG: hypothetical protein IJ079_01350 [Lachnospiraceae bacterium]|nr:hypothetical protein [Lachnospiraceae bacterium]